MATTENILLYRPASLFETIDPQKVFIDNMQLLDAQISGIKSDYLKRDGSNIVSSDLTIQSDSARIIKGTAKDGRLILTSAPTSSQTDGASIMLEGYDYGGVGSGGKIYLTTRDYNSVFVGDKKVWNQGNFDPANYLQLAGGTMTGALKGKSFIPSGYTVGNTTGVVNKYLKVADITLTGLYQWSAMKINIAGGNGGAAGSQNRAEIYFRVKQQAAMGNSPIIDLMVTDNRGIVISNIKAVTVQNDGSATKVELWIYVTSANEFVHCSPIHVQYSNYVTFYENQAVQDALPAGTQTSATYHDAWFSTLNLSTADGAGAMLNLNSGNANQYSVINFQNSGAKRWYMDYSNGTDDDLRIGKQTGSAGSEVADNFMTFDYTNSIIRMAKKLSLEPGVQALDLKAGATADQVYLAFYADSQAQNTRSGTIGYGSSGTTELGIYNEMLNGNVNITTTGTGKVKANGNEVMTVAGGTFTGIATAQNNTSYTTKQVRNVTLSTADPSGGSNGDIWIKYTP